MTREQIEERILEIMKVEFEVENPEMDDNLREKHGFDSIDAITLLEMIEDLLDSQLSQDEKKMAMEIRTINQICDYVEGLVKSRQ